MRRGRRPPPPHQPPLGSGGIGGRRPRGAPRDGQDARGPDLRHGRRSTLLSKSSVLAALEPMACTRSIAYRGEGAASRGRARKRMADPSWNAAVKGGRRTVGARWIGLAILLVSTGQGPNGVRSSRKAQRWPKENLPRCLS
jgi:hypothetical protein